MCGICGIVLSRDKKINQLPEKVRMMTKLMSHRGPDAHDYYVSNDISFGHSRLKIIDLEGGNQPMTDETGRYTIVYNGEVYNYKQIRATLEKNDVSFKTKSDTEVILKSFIHIGIDCINDFRGMFAFAIWDNNEKILFCARDRIGQKPFYYYHDDNAFYFASEIKALNALDDIDLTISNTSIYSYLTFGYMPGTSTMYKKIQKLLPAHYIYLKNGKFECKRYWKLNYQNKSIENVRAIKKNIFDVLSDATRMRMQSDVPLGAFLSGGLDSSIIVGLMSNISLSPIQTYSIGFDDNRYDETKYARAVAKYYKTEHKEYIVKPDILSIIDDLVWKFDQPFADSSSIATYYLAKMTRENVTVALNGDGGDENFSGYPRYKAAKILSLMQRTGLTKPIKLYKLLYALLDMRDEGAFTKGNIIKWKKFTKSIIEKQNMYDAYTSWFCHFNNNQRSDILTDSFKNSICLDDCFSYNDSSFHESDITDSLLNYDINTYLPDDLLVKIDCATMAVSLEARSPFLDHVFMEYVASIPSSMKQTISMSKKILKETFLDFLPNNILSRNKMGFGVPIGEWLKNDLATYYMSILQSKQFDNRGIFKKDIITEMINQHQCGKINNGYKIWNILMLELWFRKYIDKESCLS